MSQSSHESLRLYYIHSGIIYNFLRFLKIFNHLNLLNRNINLLAQEGKKE